MGNWLRLRGRWRCTRVLIQCSLCWISLLVGDCGVGFGQLNYEHEPIDYSSAEPADPMGKLAKSIRAGDIQLDYSDQHGWLPSLLKELNVPQSSQLLVFSKTSLQLHKISPRTPRAIYFNDDVYVGWCQDGDLIEVAATDPNLGAVFYTVDQADFAVPEIQRDRGRCLTCHASYRTQRIPGYLVRSIYSDLNGRPRSGTRTYVTDHTSDFEKRFGGWYVSGKHGDMRHMGNVMARGRLDPEELNRNEGANQESLENLCETQRYLTDHSDIVALMVLEHQSQMHNLIARASIETRIARHQDRGMNEILERSLDAVSPSTERRIQAAGEKLVRYMLFADELPLASRIKGTSQFAAEFEASSENRRDSSGRSLRQFDLRTRMFKYPCSYLIYSAAFDGLPEPTASFVRERLSEILFSEDEVEGYERLERKDRIAIREILLETKPGCLNPPS